MRLFRVRQVSTRPRVALPSASWGETSQMASQLPMSDHGKETGKTPALAVRSITAKSIEIFGAPAKAAWSRRTKSRSTTARSRAARAALATAGAWASSSAIIVSARNRK